MVPDVAKAGRSFKGAFAYYLHDKRQDDGPHLATADRVAWTETRNLATDDPETAKRIMIATARRADELKELAGVKATGRKSTAHVYAYALAWHPDEAASLTRAEMVRAADQSLKVLGADHLQALIVCHTDRSHPHVHVILNRVDPDTGKMLATSNDFRKLSAWAAAYEKERGKILTPAREKAPPEIRKDHTAAASPAPQKPAKGPSEAALLKDLSDAQKARHKQAWRDLAAKNKAARVGVYAAFGQQIKDAAAEHKKRTKPVWASFFREVRGRQRDFAALERSAIGKLAVAFQTAKIQQRDGQAQGAGLLSLIFANVLSSDLRRQTFERVIERDRLAVANHVKASLDSEIATVKAERSAALARQREAYLADRAELIREQDAEREKIREAWRQVYSRRGKDPRYSAQQNAARAQEQKPMQRDFDKTARPRPNAGKAPHEVRHVSHPAPTPSPAGSPPQVARKAQEVPVKSDPTFSRGAVPAKDWTKAAEPARPAGTPLPAKDWNKAADRPRDVKPFQKPSKDYDRDR